MVTLTVTGTAAARLASRSRPVALATIGGNVFLMESVPPNSFVTGKHPELHIKQNKDKA